MTAPQQPPVYCRWPGCQLELTNAKSRARGYGRRHFELMFPRAAAAAPLPRTAPPAEEPDLFDELAGQDGAER